MLTTQVEAFLEIAHQGNLSRAAEALHVSQPALTARLQALETELGQALFVRGRRGMTLTDVCRAFRPYAERAVMALDEGATLVRDLGAGGAGELVLGAAPAVSAYVLPGLLVRTGLAESKGQARRLIAQGGVYVNETRVTDPDLEWAGLLPERGELLLRKGKRSYHLVVSEG